VRRYVNIEQLRLGNRPKVEWRVDHNVDPDVQVHALIVQPLGENVIFHSIGRLPAGGGVNLSITQHEDRVVSEVSNPLPAQRPRQQHPGNKMAQDDMRQRI